MEGLNLRVFHRAMNEFPRIEDRGIQMKGDGVHEALVESDADFPVTTVGPGRGVGGEPPQTSKSMSRHRPPAKRRIRPQATYFRSHE